MGAATEIITDGVDGFFASTEGGWYDAMFELATSEAQRASIGACARHRVESTYSVTSTVPELISLLGRVADEG